MKKSALPAEFVAYITRLFLSDQRRDIRRIHRFLILRWGFWLDGHPENAIPGYATCPPPYGLSDFPEGWTFTHFQQIAKEATGSDTIHKARLRAAATGRRIDCGSGQDFGICTVCGQGHGYVLFHAAQPAH